MDTDPLKKEPRGAKPRGESPADVLRNPSDDTCGSGQEDLLTADEVWAVFAVHDLRRRVFGALAAQLEAQARELRRCV